jgi:hypothetical protein
LKGNLLKEQEKETFAEGHNAKDVLGLILKRTDDTDKELGLDMWIRAMKGTFSHNNEEAETVILQNLAQLTDSDAEPDSEFYACCYQYLTHVGEFRALTHRWDEAARRDDRTWRERSGGQPSYFHPGIDYPSAFIGPVTKSHSQLIVEARSFLGHVPWIKRWFQSSRNEQPESL